MGISASRTSRIHHLSGALTEEWGVVQKIYGLHTHWGLQSLEVWKWWGRWIDPTMESWTICMALLFKRVNYCELFMKVWASFVLFSSPSSGTLTQNEMVFRRLHLGTVAYGMDSMDEVQSHVFSAYTQVTHPGPGERGVSKNKTALQWSTERKIWVKTIIVDRNTSVCDDCLVKCFLTSDDILCPPWHQRPVKQETGLAHKQSPDGLL